MSEHERPRRYSIWLPLLAAAGGFFLSPIVAQRQENKEIIKSRKSVSSLAGDLSRSEKQLKSTQAELEKTQGELHNSQIKLEILGFKSQSLDGFNFDLVCGDYAEQKFEERFADEASDYCTERSNDSPQSAPFEP